MNGHRVSGCWRHVLRLVHDEIKNALGGEGYRLRAMLEVLCSSGIRISELLGLNLGDMEEQGQVVNRDGYYWPGLMQFGFIPSLRLPGSDRFIQH